MSKRKPARTIKARSASKIRSKAAGSGQPTGRANSKQARVLALLCGPSGATIATVNLVDNNAYTNLMARENLRYAAQTVKSLQTAEPEAYNALVRKTALQSSEVETWLRAAENMYVPYDEKLEIIPQDDSF